MDELRHWQDLLKLTAAMISPFLLAVFPSVSCEGTHVGNNVLHRPIDIPHLESGILCKKNLHKWNGLPQTVLYFSWDFSLQLSSQEVPMQAR